MRVLVFGSTGPTGREVCLQAVSRGHAASAFARTPSKLANVSGLTSTFSGDVLDATAVSSAIRSATPDAILVSLGGASIWGRDYVCSRGTENILAAVRAANLSPRIVVCTSMGVGDSADKIPGFVRWMLKHALADKEPQEAAVRSSGFPFAIVRPMGLRDTPARGAAAITAREAAALPTSAISRADVAGFMLDCLTSDTWLGKTVGIAWTQKE